MSEELAVAVGSNSQQRAVGSGQFVTLEIIASGGKLALSGTKNLLPYGVGGPNAYGEW